MFSAAIMPSSASFSEETSASSGSTTRIVHDFASLNPMVSSINSQQKIKKKRNLPGNPDPDAEVIALSPKTLLATNRFVCEVCNKGFQRDQNLQLHRRGHNLPWKLKQRNGKEVRKKAYVCPEVSCVHHHPSRALGDLTGIKKHFCRKHGEKKWKCEKCSKIYAVQSDWKAHSKTCGTREYRCDCGTLFSRKDSFITHRAFCDALAEESARLSANQLGTLMTNKPPPLFPFSSTPNHHHHFQNPWDPLQNPNPSLNQNTLLHIKPETMHHHPPPQPISSKQFFPQPPPPEQPPNHTNLATSPFASLHVSATHSPSNNAASPHLSATALLQKAATMGAHSAGDVGSTMTRFDISAGVSPEFLGFAPGSFATWQKSDRLTRDFLGLTGDGGDRGGGGDVNSGAVDVNVSMRSLLSFTGSAGYERDHSLLKAQGCFGFAEPRASETWGNC